MVYIPGPWVYKPGPWFINHSLVYKYSVSCCCCFFCVCVKWSGKVLTASKVNVHINAHLWILFIMATAPDMRDLTELVAEVFMQNSASHTQNFTSTTSPRQVFTSLQWHSCGGA